MIRRHALDTLLQRLREYPAVALVGPRQCGKTTLARSLDGVYFDLEREPECLRLDLEWDAVAAGTRLVILDEAQAWPEVFVRLRGAIDSDRRRNGRFLLLGSVSHPLMTRVSESLAGRLSLVELAPLLWSEVNDRVSLRRRWLVGGYPNGGVLGAAQYPHWAPDYVSMLTQRDLPSWGLPARPRTTERLLRMLAAVHGQRWNASEVGRSLGLPYQSVNDYVEYLEGAFLIRRLPSFQANIRKRSVKTPKLYWRDSGLLHAIRNVPDEPALLARPWAGASWEGFVLDQVIGELSSSGRPFGAWSFRTSDQYELDLVLDLEGERVAADVKLTASPTPEDMDRLDRTAELIAASRRFLISQTPRPAGNERRGSFDLSTFVDVVRSI